MPWRQHPREAAILGTAVTDRLPQKLPPTDIGGRPLDAAEIDTCQLSVVSQDGQEPFRQDLPQPVLDWAESVPYSIAFRPDRHSTSG
ncbi:hypothetical protein [Streptomyces sp. NPDC059788]|uniref:hypothetical protein n=1 Tax=Streptomyces sp. NPDC059788 TaxID=3346948 RepID=UPI00365E2805